MPALLISLIASGGLKWIIILILVVGLVVGLYLKHRKIVNSEREIALLQYNLNQSRQNLIDKDRYISELEDINKEKSQLVADLYSQRENRQETVDRVNQNIDQAVGAGKDKEASSILKDVFKELGEMK